MNIYLDVQSPAVKEAGKLASAYGLANHGLVNLRRAYWNLPTPALYEESIFRSEGSLSHLGPLVVNTGKHTARAAADKFVVREQSTEEKIWWGQYNRPVTSENFSALLARLQGTCRGAMFSCRTASREPTRSKVCPSALSRRRRGTVCLRAPCS